MQVAARARVRQKQRQPTCFLQHGSSSLRVFISSIRVNPRRRSDESGYLIQEFLGKIARDLRLQFADGFFEDDEIRLARGGTQESRRGIARGGGFKIKILGLLAVGEPERIARDGAFRRLPWISLKAPAFGFGFAFDKTIGFLLRTDRRPIQLPESIA